jgi:hypothetical protein
MAHVPWIRLYTSWPRHRKTILLRSALGTAEPILGLWCWASENAPDGDLSQFPREELEYQSGWRGEPGKAFSAMVNAGFIDIIDNKPMLHEWEDGAGAGVASLQKTRDRMREIMRTRRANGNVSEGDRLRIFARDGYKCCYCGSSEKLEVDHVISISNGGGHEDDNLKTACRSCNRKKGNRDQIESKSKSKSKSKSVKDNDNGLLTLTPPEPRSKRKGTEPTEGFLKFWEAYPRKTAKGQALKVWPGDELTDRILAALAWQVPTWGDPTYIKHPATWLNAKCWEDEKPSTPSATYRQPQQTSLRVGHTRAEDFKHDTKTGEVDL